MEILVRQEHTPRQIKVAAAKSNEFRKNRYTSGYAHLDDLIALGKAVILCDSHVRRFDAGKARYRAHPDKNMRRVISQCDICQVRGYGWLFLNEKDAHEAHVNLRRFMGKLEYARVTAK